MKRKMALAIGLPVAAVCVLALTLLFASEPDPVLSYPEYTYKAGCHCGAPKTTTTRKPTPTTKKPTVTTKRATPRTTTTGLVGTTSSTATTLPADGGQPAAVLAMAGGFAGLYDPDTMEAAKAFLAGLALASTGSPPEGPGSDGGAGPTDGSTGDVAGGEVAAIEGSADAAVAGESVDLMAAEGPVGPAMSAPHYYVSPVALLFFLVYGCTFILYKTKNMKVTTHRKVWNVLLMLTFLVTGVFGLILAIGISQNPPWLLPRWLLFWHVEIGIVMALISFFHMGWHLRYYAALVTGRAGWRRSPGEERQRVERIRDTRPPAGRPAPVPIRVDDSPDRPPRR